MVSLTESIVVFNFSCLYSIHDKCCRGPNCKILEKLIIVAKLVIIEASVAKASCGLIKISNNEW